MHLGSPLKPWGPMGTQGSPRGSTSKFIEPKNLTNKRCKYDSLIINVLFIGLLTYYVATGKLPTEASVVTPHSTGGGGAELNTINFKTTHTIVVSGEAKPSYL